MGFSQKPGDSMTISAPSTLNSKSQLRKTMGFWDVLLFNIATVLGPRWIAAAGHNGTSSISLWVLAAVFFFVPGALVINELSSRFPEEGGLYAWSREAFGPFHGLWPGGPTGLHRLLFSRTALASASMAAYIIGGRGVALAQDRTFLLTVSLSMLLVAVVLNIIGLNVGKWLQNAGGVGTYVPLVMLAGVAAIFVFKHGSATHFTVQNMLPTWNWDTVNFWSQIAFAFTGLELVATMSEEVRDPRRTLPRAVFGAGALIALMYIVGTFAVLALVPAAGIDPRAASSTPLPWVRWRCAWALWACWRPFWSPWATPAAWVRRWPALPASLCGGRGPLFTGSLRQDSPQVENAVCLHPGAGHHLRRNPAGQPDQRDHARAYQFLIDAAIILYFIPFLYMFAAVIKLARRRDRREIPTPCWCQAA